MTADSTTTPVTEPQEPELAGDEPGPFLSAAGGGVDPIGQLAGQDLAVLLARLVRVRSTALYAGRTIRWGGRTPQLAADVRTVDAFNTELHGYLAAVLEPLVEPEERVATHNAAFDLCLDLSGMNQMLDDVEAGGIEAESLLNPERWGPEWRLTEDGERRAKREAAKHAA